VAAHSQPPTSDEPDGRTSANGETRRALITGVSGQDGSFLAELLLEKGYAVTGVLRDPERLGCTEHLRAQIELVPGDLLVGATLREAIAGVRPHEIYHLAAPSFVPDSWTSPEETFRAIVGSAAAMLETVRELDRSTRVFMSASAAIFGNAGDSPQREDTPCQPTTPYAVAKLAAHQLLGLLRARDGLHASSGIFFNHESERRPERFVTRRITRAAAAISLGLQQELTLGDLSAVRDWSFAGDMVRGAWLMLQQERPDDYVLASGVPRTVADFARTAFACVDLDAERHLRVDPALVRTVETTPSIGDPTRARERLGWAPLLDFQQLVERMVQADLRELRGVTTTP
jgi:GDPmannose 4,6-dehydratase